MIKIKFKKKINESEEENPILVSNVDFVLENDEAYAALEDLDLNTDDIMELIAAIPVLNKVKISEFISGHSFGKIFKLEDGRVIKLFSSSRNVQDDLKWYEQSGREIGKWGYEGRDPVYWVVMPFYVPYDQYLTASNRDLSQAEKEFKLLINFFIEKKSTSAEEFLRWVQTNKINKPTNIKMEEIKPILKSVQKVYKFNQDLEDVNVRNIGLTTNDSGEVDQRNLNFVVFDR